MPYSIRLPDGRIMQGIPDEVPPEEAKRRIIAAGIYKEPVPETTALGHTKELFKGLVPGAIGLVEGAVTGAAALLPDEAEKAVRKTTGEIAAAAKKPFEAAPGYEQAVSRKLSEAVGSTLPFLPLGALGLAGRAGAVALGTGAGAGEARTRAEKEGATEGQRATATALGTIPGALEVLVPFRILSRIPEKEVLSMVQIAKRAAISGGEEAAQEAVSAATQNLIAKGIYKPDQALIEGVGENAAYGAGAGAIIQGVMDMALGRRAKGPGTAGQPTESTGGVMPIEEARDRYEVEKAAAIAEREAKKAGAPAAAEGPVEPTEPIQEPAAPAATAAPEAPAAPAVTPEEPAAPEVPEVPEPVVVKPEEPVAEEPTAPEAEPETKGITEEQLQGLGLTKKQPIYRRMLGKDLDDSEQRTAVLTDVENYLNKGLGTEESRARLDEFKQAYTPATAPEPAAAPEGVQDVREAVTEPSGVSVPVVGESSVGATTAEPSASVPSGVVSAGQDVGEPAGRTAAEPSAVDTSKSATSIEEVIEAVGAYNSPNSDVLRRQLALDYIYGTATDANEQNIAVKDFALRALKNAVDSKDLRPSQRAAYDALVKNVPEDDSTPWDTYRYVKREELRGAVVPQATTAAEAGDTRAALIAIRDAKEEGVRELDRVVARRLLQLSTLPAIRTLPVEQVKGDAQYDTRTDTVEIAQGQVDTHTVMHETVHSAMHKLIQLNAAGRRKDAGYQDLKKLYDFLKKDHAYLDKEYGMRDLSEFASEAMSNPEFQYKLNQIPYKTQTAFQWFGNAVRRLLNIPEGQGTAFLEAIVAIDKTLFEGRTAQRTEAADAGVLPVKRKSQPTVVQAPPAPQAPAPAAPSTRPPDIVGEVPSPTVAQKTTAKLGPNKIIGMRAQFADSIAGMGNVFNLSYGGRIKDSRGNANPEVLTSRAIDAGRFSQVVQEYGTMVVDPSGMTNVVDLYMLPDGNYKANPTEAEIAQLTEAGAVKVSLESIFKEDIVDEAKRQGVDKEQFYQKVGNLIAAHREYELLQQFGLDNGIEYFYTPEELQTLEAEYQNSDAAKRITDKLNAIRFSLIDLMVETGRISEEQATEWMQATAYAPFERIDELDAAFEKHKGSARRGISVAKQIKSYAGSEERQINNPIGAFSRFVDYAVNESMKNEASRRALTELEMLKFAEFVPDRGAVDQNKHGLIASTYVNGVKKEYYVPDPAIYAAFVALPTEVSSVIKALQKGSRLLRAGVTTMPPFAVKQIVDDVTRGYVYSGVDNPLPMIARALTMMPVNWVREIAGYPSAAIKALQKVGVVATYDFGTDQSNLRDVMAEAGLKKRSIGSTIFRIMEAGAKASDISIREAIYNQTMKETGDSALAETRAREIINFSRRGSARAMDTMIRTVPFFNAYARGMDKLLLAATGNTAAQKSIGVSTTGAARSMFHKRMLVMTAIGFAYAMLMWDDEEYQKLEDHVRDRNWVLPVGKEFIEKYGYVPTISVPSELSFFFKAIPERIVRYFKLQGTDEERDTMSLARELLVQGVDIFLAPNPTPQLLKPILENIANYSFFLGRPLESQAQLRQLPQTREGYGTSELSKATAGGAAEYLGIEFSPIKMDNLLRGLFGTSAGVVLSVTDAMINPTRTDRPLHQQMASQLTGASAFMKDGVSSRYISDIYKLDEKVNQAYNSFNAELKEGNGESAARIYKQNYGYLQVRDAVVQLLQDIRETNALARYVDKAKDISPEDRRKLITDLRMKQNDIARITYSVRKIAREQQAQADKLSLEELLQSKP